MVHTILFTGHMIDKSNRAIERFAAPKEQNVKEAIKQQLLIEKNNRNNNLCGIASGACGGDILFHELCMELNIATAIYLAKGKEEFKTDSVSFAGKQWEERFDVLVENYPVHILQKQESISKKNVWELTNEWMLNVALKNGGDNMTLLALWDGQKGDDAGGTQHMIDIAKSHHAVIKIIDIKKL